MVSCLTPTPIKRSPSNERYFAFLFAYRSSFRPAPLNITFPRCMPGSNPATYILCRSCSCNLGLNSEGCSREKVFESHWDLSLSNHRLKCRTGGLLYISPCCALPLERPLSQHLSLSLRRPRSTNTPLNGEAPLSGGGLVSAPYLCLPEACLQD